MSAAQVGFAASGIGLGSFAVAYLVALFLTRPAPVTPAAATPDLGEEPPAVASLLANRWRVTVDAAESTVLDLAARGLLELHQTGDDPEHTTIHLRATEPGELTPYEHRVLSRVWATAVDGSVPVTALSFRDRGQARTWNRQLRREVIRDARSRGLCRSRFSGRVRGWLTLAALAGAIGVGLAAKLAFESDMSGALWAGFIANAVLFPLANRSPGWRDTAAGRAAASRWLGVRDWLRGHEEFANLPPASVTVWDRYLAYGAALGVTHTASAILELGLGDRRRVWSAYTGRWRRVRVRYPRVWRRYGRTVPRLALRAGAALLAGVVLARQHAAAWWPLPGSGGGTPGPAAEAPTRVLQVVGWWLLAYGGYVLVRALVDLVTTERITGEVLWLAPWRRRWGRDHFGEPWLDYLAVDDGTADRTTAWGLPRETRPRCHPHEVVTIEVRPWSRRVMRLSVEPAVHDVQVDQPVARVPEPRRHGADDLESE